jgi:hypothetical protein
MSGVHDPQTRESVNDQPTEHQTKDKQLQEEQPKGDAARPLVTESFHTADLPPLPQRDRRLPASLWVEAPEQLRQLGQDLGHELVIYKRQIGSWLLWRAGPAVDDNARYMALHAADLTKQFTFTLDAEGKGTGTGPDDVHYDRFRTWKESLRDTP